MGVNRPNLSKKKKKIDFNNIASFKQKNDPSASLASISQLNLSIFYI